MCRLIIVILLVLLSAQVVRADDSPVSIKAIRRAWEQRAKDLSGSLLQWTEERVYPKGELLSPHDPEPLEADLTITWRKKLIISTDKCRVEGIGMTSDYRVGGMAPFEFTAVRNGTGSSYHNFPDQRNNLGYFTKSFENLADVTYRPALLGTNPADPEFGRINLSEYHVEPGLTEINGRECIKLESNKERSIEGRIFLDPERQFVITRVVSSTGDQISRQLDLTYRSDSRDIWYPASWGFQIMNGRFDGFSLLISGTTVEFDSQHAASPEDFEIQYRPGTLIYDQRTPGDNRIRVRADGSLRVLQPFEFKSPQKRQPKPEAETSGVPSRRWLFGINLAVIAAVSCVFFFQSRRRRKDAIPQE